MGICGQHPGRMLRLGVAGSFYVFCICFRAFRIFFSAFFGGEKLTIIMEEGTDIRIF